MTTVELFLIALAVVFVINVIPAFMPSTWMVIAFFVVVYKLPLWPLCFGGAVSATAGRCCLALLSKRLGRRFLSAKQRQNVDALGTWLNSKSGWSLAGAVFVYALGPIPSNQIFIAAGLSDVKLGPVAAGFFAGRLVSYPIAASSVKKVSSHFDNIFTSQWKNPRYVILELLSLASIVVFAKIDWTKVLHIKVPTAQTDGSGQASNSAAASTGTSSRLSSPAGQASAASAQTSTPSGETATSSGETITLSGKT